MNFCVSRKTYMPFLQGCWENYLNCTFSCMPVSLDAFLIFLYIKIEGKLMVVLFYVYVAVQHQEQCVSWRIMGY